ncbi:glycoside hydrolase family 43 protein [Streptomyces albidoflavus]|uniref:glycoside hydrolase family 43 protein n=1 Tax=Streptomyces albidoflavus TaxID=1886 RepID=UPI00342AB30D
MTSSRRIRALVGALLSCALAAGLGLATASPAAAGQVMRAADPSVIRVGSTYVSVQSAGGGLVVRQASSTEGLAGAEGRQVWADSAGLGEVWAPEIVRDGGRYYIYFAAGRGAAHRMYVISSDQADQGYGGATKLALPEDKWAIDGALFTFEGQRWFVWSGWEGDTDVEQNLYLARMNSPTEPTGPRYVISQPRESWERVVGNPFINEGPEPIMDPNGQLHIAYSANGSWSDQYCVADLRLRMGGVDGPGHHSFVLLDGDIATSPPAGPRSPSMFHAVAKGTPYAWENRHWYTGTFTWWGETTYRRSGVPGAETDTGWSLKYFE